MGFLDYIWRWLLFLFFSTAQQSRNRRSHPGPVINWPIASLRLIEIMLPSCYCILPRPVSRLLPQLEWPFVIVTAASWRADTPRKNEVQGERERRADNRYFSPQEVFDIRPRTVSQRTERNKSSPKSVRKILLFSFFCPERHDVRWNIEFFSAVWWPGTFAAVTDRARLSTRLWLERKKKEPRERKEWQEKVNSGGISSAGFDCDKRSQWVGGIIIFVCVCSGFEAATIIACM